MENPIKMDDLGVPLFLETPICFFWVDQTEAKENSSEQWGCLRCEKRIWELKLVPIAQLSSTITTPKTEHSFRKYVISWMWPPPSNSGK